MHTYNANSTLLPDESYCKSALGTMIYADRKRWGFHAEVVDVREPTSALFGHVEYDLIMTATPHNSIEMEPKRFAVTTRFKEMHKMYGQLSTIHRQVRVGRGF
jgi:hypothetical protein